ncbi:MAG TPA: M1 family metallopeptidase [Longimicrobiaceae bacterium]|nr:M1 family metallopeptidase [Longimicrobiaceae bacterium]
MREPLVRHLVLLVALASGGCATAAPPPASRPVPAAAAPSAPERPIPYPVVPTAGFRAAVAAGTRTTSGAPGPRYWTNRADYDISVRLDPQAKRVEGTETVRYQNRSPDTLGVLVLDLTQNIHAPGAVRLEPQEVTGGIELSRVAVGGTTLSEGRSSGPHYLVDDTKLAIVPPRPVLPGQSVNLSLDWSFVVAHQGAGGRMGYDRDLFFLGYFYPQMAVYDDVRGWNTDQFLSPGEFYDDFGHYRVTLRVPEGWLVEGTGVLQNPASDLAAPVLARLRAAEQSDTVVHVVTPADFGHVTPGAGSGELSWTFVADSVHDVAYSVTKSSNWDVTRAPVGDRDGDGQTDYARIGAIWRPQYEHWSQGALYAQRSIAFLSRYTGFSYPWPHMTAVEGAGIIGGGMEYPMMTLIGPYTGLPDSRFFSTVAHELAHMWVPMVVAVDERRFGWMDEGTTTFNEEAADSAYFPELDQWLRDRESYLRAARAGDEGPMMRRTDYQYPGEMVTASYDKPATVLNALKGLLGPETFDRAYHEFIRRWAYKHPYPWDLFNTFNDVSGRNLDWFWRSWYYETWLLDQAVQSVVPSGDSTVVTIADKGNVPMPARLTVTLANGDTLKRELPVETWLRGARQASVTVPSASPVTSVVIDAENAFPDADRSNNSWTR